MTTALIVPVLNNFKGLSELVRSVDIPVLPVVIDNWNNNIGVGPGWNVGLDLCIAQQIDKAIIVNDDVVFRHGVASRMLHMLDQGYDLVSPQNETGVCHPYGLNFWCFAIRPEQFVDRFGYFDENFAPAYYEDDDMAYRMKLAGGKMLNLPNKIYHSVMGTEVSPEVHSSLYRKNLAYYVEKWGGEPQHEEFKTPFNRIDRSIKDW